MAGSSPSRRVFVCQHTDESGPCGKEFVRGRSNNGYEPRFCPEHRGQYVGKRTDKVAQPKSVAGGEAWWTESPADLGELSDLSIRQMRARLEMTDTPHDERERIWRIVARLIDKNRSDGGAGRALDDLRVRVFGDGAAVRDR